MASYSMQMYNTVKEEDVLHLVNGLVIPRKSFDFTTNGRIPSTEHPPITVNEGLDDIVNAFLKGRMYKNNPPQVEALDNFWAREHAAAIFALELLKDRDEDRNRDEDRRYEDYLPGRFLMYKRLVDDGIKEIIPNLKGKNVIEVGSGSGISLTMLAREGAKTWALDISETALGFFQFLSKHYGVSDRITTIREDFYKTGLPTNGFDLAYNVGVFEHREPQDRTRLLEEMKRITAPGGYVMISVPNLKSPHYRAMRKREENLFHRLRQYMYPERAFHDIDPKKLLTEAGLEVVKHDYALLAPSTPIERKVIKPEDYEFFLKLPHIEGKIETTEKIKIWELLEESASPLQKERYGWFVYAIGRKK